MIRKIIVLISIILLSAEVVSAQLYIGAGPEYAIPQDQLAEVNQESFGVTLQLESRRYCNLWYGLRFDYIFLEKIEDFDEDINFFEDAVLISPQIRWSFLGKDCFTGKFLPYIQGMLTISSIGGTDNLNRLGLGMGGGGGIAIGFTIFDLCWMADLNAIYSAPNAIWRAEPRHNLQSINLSFNLSVEL
jgi:hypothetical protein